MKSAIRRSAIAVSWLSGRRKWCRRQGMESLRGRDRGVRDREEVVVSFVAKLSNCGLSIRVVCPFSLFIISILPSLTFPGLVYSSSRRGRLMDTEMVFTCRWQSKFGAAKGEGFNERVE